MREDMAGHSKLQFCEKAFKGLSKELQEVSNIVIPAQIHHYAKTLEQYARKRIGAQFELAIEIAEDLGPVPGDYITLLLDILIECAKYLDSLAGAMQSVQLQLSELRSHSQFSYIIMEIQYRDPIGLTGNGLSEELSRLRRQTEEYCGAFLIDSASREEIRLRVLLPVISWVF